MAALPAFSGLFRSKPPHFKAIILSVHREAGDVRRFIFQVTEPSRFVFRPGQFVTFRIPHENKLLSRSYSIASAPGESNEFELVIVHKPDGLGTGYIWDHFTEGTILEGKGPLGKFTLENSAKRELCFISTGTGIAPLRSMIADMYNKDMAPPAVTLISGYRNEAGILYKEDFEALARKHPGFRFIPVLSRATEEEWKGERGHVHEVYTRLFTGKTDVVFYLCGWKQMLTEARDRLMGLGFNKEDIRFEAYD